MFQLSQANEAREWLCKKILSKPQTFLKCEGIRNN